MAVTLCAGMQFATLLRHGTQERPIMNYHAERGNYYSIHRTKVVGLPAFPHIARICHRVWTIYDSSFQLWSLDKPDCHDEYWFLWVYVDQPGRLT